MEGHPHSMQSWGTGMRAPMVGRLGRAFHAPGTGAISGPADVQRAERLCDIPGTQREAFKFRRRNQVKTWRGVQARRGMQLGLGLQPQPLSRLSLPPASGASPAPALGPLSANTPQ